MTVPQTMRASVLTEVGVIELQERPVPVPAAGEVLVQVASVGVCGSDVHYYEHGRIAHFVVESPLVLGHELSGTIVAVGADVAPERIGERVAVEPQKPCRTCEQCKSGAYNLCPDMEFFATPPIDGAFCEYVTIGADFAFAVPDDVSDHAAALIEPLSVGLAAVRTGGVAPGQTVLVAGGGPIGLIAAQAARAFGATTVVVAEPDASRRELVAAHGFTPLDPMSEQTTDLGAHVFIDASGVVPAIQNGLRSVRSGGTVVLVGSADVVPLSVGDIAMREVNVTGTFRYTNTWPLAIDLLRSGAVELDGLVTHEYGLDQVEQALNAEATPSSLKRMVLPGTATVEHPELATRSAS